MQGDGLRDHGGRKQTAQPHHFGLRAEDQNQGRSVRVPVGHQPGPDAFPLRPLSLRDSEVAFGSDLRQLLVHVEVGQVPSDCQVPRHHRSVGQFRQRGRQSSKRKGGVCVQSAERGNEGE